MRIAIPRRLFCATKVRIASARLVCPSASRGAEDLEDAVLAARGREALGHAVVEGEDADAVEVREGDVRQGGGDPLGVAQLRRRAEAHRPGAVDEDVDREVLFFLEEPQEQSPVPLVDVPVEVAEVVARGVLAVVGELDAAAGLLRAALGAGATRVEAARDDREVFELSLELLVEELVVVAGVGGRIVRTRRLQKAEHELTRSRAPSSGSRRGPRRCSRLPLHLRSSGSRGGGAPT